MIPSLKKSTPKCCQFALLIDKKTSNFIEITKKRQPCQISADLPGYVLGIDHSYNKIWTQRNVHLCNFKISTIASRVAGTSQLSFPNNTIFASQTKTKVQTTWGKFLYIYLIIVPRFSYRFYFPKLLALILQEEYCHSIVSMLWTGPWWAIHVN